MRLKLNFEKRCKMKTNIAKAHRASTMACEGVTRALKFSGDTQLTPSADFVKPFRKAELEGESQGNQHKQDIPAEEQRAQIEFRREVQNEEHRMRMMMVSRTSVNEQEIVCFLCVPIFLSPKEEDEED
ncbi:hypothetical protein SRHO_G00264570 [Serrasalmus rhombeus]